MEWKLLPKILKIDRHIAILSSHGPILRGICLAKFELMQYFEIGYWFISHLAFFKFFIGITWEKIKAD